MSKRAGWVLACLLLPSTPLARSQNPPDPPPEPVRTSITVVEKIEAETPAFITSLAALTIRQQPGVNLDDRLRAIPGFSLFRRSSSLVANPTTQGVSLRGLGSSGASRTLVLWDGVPLNDPFGGWVYWTRVAPEELDRVEVSRGAATSVFGDRAMSGAISLFSRAARPWNVTGAYEGGNRRTHLLEGGFSHLGSRFGGSANIRAFTTDGYYTVRGDRRGAVDTPANVRFAAGDTRFDWLGGADRLFIRLDILAEERDNGTVLTHNSTSLGTIAANYARQWAGNALSVLVYHTREEYRAGFSAVSTDRNTERLTSIQTVPSQAAGAAGIWRHGAANWNLIAGADAQRVEGTSTDRLFPAGVRIGRGSQWQQGTFAQTDVIAGPLRLFLGARHNFVGDQNRFFSPSAGLVVGRGAWRARGSVYRSFRAPTLNELFRPFRVGNAETQANPLLRPEKLFGSEAGIDYTGEYARVSVNFFRNELDDLITNVTLSSTATQIVRQRQNAGAALSRGMDVNTRMRWRNWTGELGYLFADSRFSTGERIPQVPRHAGSAQLTWLLNGTFVSAGLRAFSLQFEDDRNQFGLPGFLVAQFSLRQRLVRGLSAVAALENALDREYLTGFTPVPLAGSPRLWRAGLRWDGAIR